MGQPRQIVDRVVELLFIGDALIQLLNPKPMPISVFSGAARTSRSHASPFKSSAALRQVASAGLNVYGRLRSKRYDPRKTRVIACAGRSGSTWLAEIVCADERRPLIWEPLHPGSHPNAAKIGGFGWQHYLRPGDDAPRERAFVADILAGRNLSADILSRDQLRMRQLAKFDGYVVKFTCANLLLHWLLATFPQRAVLMVRHPCAVIASQRRHGGWDHVGVDNMTVPVRLLDAFPHMRDVVAGLRTQVQVLAFEWALQVFVPLSAPRPYPFYLLTYEELVTDGERSVEQVYAHLQLPAVAQGKSVWHRLSGTAGRDNTDREGFLTGWQQYLSSAEIDQILTVTRSMGIDFYGRQPMVNRSKLHAFAGCAQRYAAQR